MISTWTYPLPSSLYGMHASYLHMDTPTTIMYIWHACILSPHGHNHDHHVCMACVHLISSWTYPPSIMYVSHACILSPHGHPHYHHVCIACMHRISTWTYQLPSYMYGMHASYLLMDMPTTIMCVRHACTLSPHGYTDYHHVSMACMHHISACIYPLPSCMYGMHASYLHMDYHHVCMTCLHLIISTWTCPLPLCMYGMHASYHRMDIPTAIMCIGHGRILSADGHTYQTSFFFHSTCLVHCFYTWLS